MEGAIKLEDASVVAALRAGNTDAFAEVVEHYQAAIIRYLFRLTGDEELARDLAQDTFVRAYQAILRTRSDLHLKAWLYRIATNNALQHRRRRKIVSFIFLEEWRRPRAAQTADDPADIAAVQQALGRVPTEQRVCLVLHFVEGFRYAEIAEMAGTTEEAVRKRVARGKAAFRRAFNGGEDT